MAAVTERSTFAMDEIARGEADLFVCAPSGSMGLLAPWLRVLLDALLHAVEHDRRDGDERVVAFIDEAASLGKFDALQRAVGAAPGEGLSIWTFWQSSAQLRGAYGQGAETFFDAAEARMAFNIPPGKPAREWSEMLGDYTIRVRTTGEGERAGGDTVSHQKRALMTPDEIASMPRDELLVLTSGEGTPTRPMRLRKTNPFRERRFRGLIDRKERPPRIG